MSLKKKRIQIRNSNSTYCQTEMSGFRGFSENQIQHGEKEEVTLKTSKGACIIILLFITITYI